MRELRGQFGNRTTGSQIATDGVGTSSDGPARAGEGCSPDTVGGFQEASLQLLDTTLPLAQLLHRWLLGAVIVAGQSLDIGRQASLDLKNKSAFE